ncbi:MAG: SagB/ThcOx family dehydrogenase [Chloroflexi bacterium]|nr:SagB/ThcOx family dehydrogenase [Chloroflexota bacterium]
MSVEKNRQFMKSAFAESVHERSDQAKGVPFPPLQKPIPEDKPQLIDLPEPDPGIFRKAEFHKLLKDRQSKRKYTAEFLSQAELAYLLWSTQGVIQELGRGHASRRTVPSGGARHAFETYLLINRVEGLEPGVYRYLPFSHQLYFQEPAENLPGLLTEANLGQKFVGNAAVVFAWSCIPYRAEWRYMEYAHKNLLLDAGHVCQNLYLAVEAIGLGTCAIGAYDQAAMDTLLELDGEDEYVIYLAPVGKI